MIEHKGLQATWTFNIGVWISTDKRFAEMLNSLLPEDDELSPSVPFRTGGMDKLVLDKVKAVFGKALKVIAFVPDPAPEEQEGVVY